MTEELFSLFLLPKKVENHLQLYVKGAKISHAWWGRVTISYKETQQ